MFYQTWRFIWTSGIAKLNAFCDWCSSVAYCNAVRLWVVSMVDSDGSVDDPDAPNQITEGSRRLPTLWSTGRVIAPTEVNALRFLHHQPPTWPYCSQGKDGNVGTWKGMVWGASWGGVTNEAVTSITQKFLPQGRISDTQDLTSGQIFYIDHPSGTRLDVSFMTVFKDFMTKSQIQ